MLRETMPNLMIEMDYLGKDINSFISTGVEIARLELEEQHVCLETNGEEGNMYLELVTYNVTERGDHVEDSFSDPVYEMPTNTEEVENLFKDWLEVGELMDDSFTGGKEHCDEKGYYYMSYENGKPVKVLSPYFPERNDFVAWMEKHYM